jgi:plastocyanin
VGEHQQGAPRRLLLLVAASGVAVFGAIGIASAGDGGGSMSQAAPDTATIAAVGQGLRQRFQARSRTIAEGGTLRIRNRTQEPHTITLVRSSVLPTTRRQQRRCFVPGHICYRAAGWHRALDKNDANDLDRVDVRQPGFDTLGALRKKGDSIFFNRRPRSVTVSAASGRTLPFFCIIHPWMLGRINVE